MFVAAVGTEAASGLGLAAPGARLVGDVRVCNTPAHCLTRTFEVDASDARGRVVAHTLTSGVDNHYVLVVPAGRYTVHATSDGLRCGLTTTTTAVAGRTSTVTITCLVP